MRVTCWSGLRRGSPTARVAAGAFAKLLLRYLGIEVCSHVIRVGRVELERTATWDEIAAVAERPEIVLSCVDAATEARMKEEVEAGFAHRRHGGRRV